MPLLPPGMEVAAYLSDKAHSVSVVELEEVPFKKFFGERVGRAIMKVRAAFVHFWQAQGEGLNGSLTDQ